MEDRRIVALGSLGALSDELLDKVIKRLTIRDVCCLSCVSSVLNVFCSEEPLWIHMCLSNQVGDDILKYSNSWRYTTLSNYAQENDLEMPELGPPLQFSGFNSFFLYQRWYRCHVSLDGFIEDNNDVPRLAGVTPEQFKDQYDGRVPIILTDLADTWPARTTWTPARLAEGPHADVALKVSVSQGRPVKMRLRDYVDYMGQQNDEEPLYVFDEAFGETAPALLSDWSVPPHFARDLLAVMGPTRRPHYRWVIAGPARSGASWHVDPALTCAWNTLLTGQKRWALYPPGRVPPGVSIHLDEETGEVDYETTTSLRWWLEVYPHLNPCDRPLVCTQNPGETIFVPSGWWHAVLNLNPTVAVTQNLATPLNLRQVALDMAPGFRHRGVARAGQVAEAQCARLDRERSAGGSGEWEEMVDGEEDEEEAGDGEEDEEEAGGKDEGEAGAWWWEEVRARWDRGELPPNGMQEALTRRAELAVLDGGAAGGGQVASDDLRLWLRRLWEEEPALRSQVWEAACVAMQADTWQRRVDATCRRHGLPTTQDHERLPLGTGHNLVYLVGGYAVKVLVDNVGGQHAVKLLARELEFYRALQHSTLKNPALKKLIPEPVASGILFSANDGATPGAPVALPWDGDGPEPAPPAGTHKGTKKKRGPVLVGGWRGVRRRGGSSPEASVERWPYLVLRRCEGTDLMHLYDDVTDADFDSLSSLLGQAFTELHSLPLPPPAKILDLFKEEEEEDKEGEEEDNKGAHTAENGVKKSENGVGGAAEASRTSDVPRQWSPFVEMLRVNRGEIVELLEAFDFMPKHLLRQLSEYLPKDPAALINPHFLTPEASHWPTPSWLHSDPMDDNILLVPHRHGTLSGGPAGEALLDGSAEESGRKWTLNSLLDFGGVAIGDPLYDIACLHLSSFRCNPTKLQKFLKCYKLPEPTAESELSTNGSKAIAGSGNGLGESGNVEAVLRHQIVEDKLQRRSYRALCYCFLHEHVSVKHIFKHRLELRRALTLEEVEDAVWGVLNSV